MPTEPLWPEVQLRCSSVALSKAGVCVCAAGDSGRWSGLGLPRRLGRCPENPLLGFAAADAPQMQSCKMSKLLGQAE